MYHDTRPVHHGLEGSGGSGFIGIGCAVNSGCYFSLRLHGEQEVDTWVFTMAEGKRHGSRVDRAAKNLSAAALSSTTA
jgi:hypothetical protein